MLILSRLEKQQIRIGDDVVVKIISIRGGQVRLGIEAPSNIAVHREEIYLKIHESKLKAELEDKVV